ncbi:TPA: hypothetical protein SB591_000318 [Campylobacter coli]|nr:hypothetical protein [Campylobacter coli]
MKQNIIKQHDIKNIELVLPNFNLDYTQEFPELNSKQIKRIKDNLGFSRHYICNQDTYASDLAAEALKNIFKNFDPKKLDALIVISPSPDFLAPPMSFIIHKKLNLSNDLIMIDRFGFCASVIQGIFEGFSLLNNKNLNNVIVVYTSAISKKIKDKNFFMYSSDSASAILITKSKMSNKCMYVEQNFSDHTLKETIPMTGYKNGIDELKIDNNIFFSFVQDKLPIFFNDITSNQIKPDFYLLHSPNKFTYSQLISKLNIDKNKIPNAFAFENFGFLNANSIMFDLFLNQHLLGNNLLMMSQGASISLSAIFLKIQKNTKINLNFFNQEEKDEKNK